MVSKLVHYVVVATLVAAPVGLWGQAAAGSAAQPVASATQPAVSAARPLAGVHYRYWPEQLVQWIGPELPYSMIVVSVDDRGKQPVYDAELVDKSAKEAVHYTNSAAQLALDKRLGLTAYQVAMKFDGPADPEQGAQYMLRFNTEKGVPVVWQFVLGTDVTEQGSGLTAIPAKAPVLMYREQGGLAGQGTAVQIGGVTSAAGVWKELAQPPYFVPYHGALSTGVHLLSFSPTATMWEQSPGGLTDQAGDVLSVTKSADGMKMTNAALGVAAEFTLGANNAVSQVTFGPVNAKRDHTVSLEFTPALASGAQSKFEVIAGKKSKIAEGTVDAAVQDSGATWKFTKPDSLK
ncbi:MAG: hypothetical protein WAM66_05935 [Acidobacteriaceae bacterium]